uniref:Neuropeptide-Like Protein n=1 Tax=Caenorhabditis tropicalis TaxID=1561998 RepID=A0A1I7U024_9PELO
MQSMWIFVLLASTATVALCSGYEDYETPVDSYEMADYMSKHAAILIPRRLVLTHEDSPLENIQSRILKRRAMPEDGFTKRATSSADRLAAIPRSGLMISGRGWMPGFVDQPRVFKRVSDPNNPIMTLIIFKNDFSQSLSTKSWYDR